MLYRPSVAAVCFGCRGFASGALGLPRVRIQLCGMSISFQHVCLRRWHRLLQIDGGTEHIFAKVSPYTLCPLSPVLQQPSICPSAASASALGWRSNPVDLFLPFPGDAAAAVQSQPRPRPIYATGNCDSQHLFKPLPTNSFCASVHRLLLNGCHSLTWMHHTGSGVEGGKDVADKLGYF